MKLKLLSENDLDVVRILFSFTLAAELNKGKADEFHDDDGFLDSDAVSSCYTIHFTDGIQFYILGATNFTYAVKIGSDVRWLDSLQIEQQFPQHWKMYMRRIGVRPSEAKGFIYRSYNERERREWLEVMRNRP